MYPPPLWFLGARLNYAETMLVGALEMPDAVAIVQADEAGIQGRMTFKELRAGVHRVSTFLSMEVGLQSGDVVAAYASNRLEVVIFMLAAASLGALFTAASPDFGPSAVCARFSQMRRLKCLLISSHVTYHGKPYVHLDKACALLHLLYDAGRTDLSVVLLQATVAEKIALEVEQAGFVKRWLRWEDLPEPSTPLMFAQLPFEHPLFIVYSSGSTGAPKAIVHGVGGVLLQHGKEHTFHGDIRPGCSLLQVTTVAWMMWHWSVSVLARCATVVLYDGSPLSPNPLYLWHLIAELKVSHVGSSAKHLALLQEQRINLPSLPHLRFLYSTGSPLAPRVFDYIYRQLPHVRLFSITGGTDILSLFCGGNPAGPIYRGEISVPCLGMDIKIFANDTLLQRDDSRSAGGSFEEGIVGDLVCIQVFPIQPICFHGDTGEIYRNAYFSVFGPQVWHHGDYVQRNPSKL
jgi:acetoacetyl-CoA synthetase